MDNSSQQNPLPEKVLKRHAALVAELLPDFARLVTTEGRPADALLNTYLRSRREMGSRDRRFLSQAVFSYFRWQGWSVGKLGLGPSEACLLGALLDSAELPPSFQHLGELPFTLEPQGGKSVAEKCAALNAARKELPGYQPLALADLVPPEFLAVVDPEMAGRCIAAFQERPPAWIRTRGDAAALVKTLAEHGVPATLHARAAGAIAIESGTSLAHALGPQAAQYVVQDIASQCVGLACAPEKGQDWWDCCAGAGGKALQLIDLMQQDGKVLATDVRAAALKELKKRARQYGIRNIRTQPFNAVSDEPFRKTFDGVVADAPCSGWGTWSRNPDARWRTSGKEVVQCAARQLKILGNATWCVKPGGVLVYAVCSLTRPETEEVVMNFLDQHPRFRLDPFAHPLTGEPTSGSLQIWPWEGPGDAMFIARFRRDPE